MRSGIGHSVGLSITFYIWLLSSLAGKKEDTGNLAKHRVSVVEQDNMDADFSKNRSAAALTVKIRRK